MTKTDEPATPVLDPLAVEKVPVPVDKGPVARQYFKEDAPWVVSFRVPVHLEAMIRSESTASGVSLNTVMVKTMEAGFHPPSEVETQPHTLETAAYTFFEVLEADHQTILMGNVEAHKRSMAEYMLSAIKRVHEQGETSFVMPDAALPPDVGVESDRTPVEEEVLACEHCHAIIALPYTRKGQRYCHDPEPALVALVEDAEAAFGPDSDECAAALKTLHACPVPCGRQAQLKSVSANREKHVKHASTARYAMDTGTLLKSLVGGRRARS